MVYLASQLIIDSYGLSDVVGTGFQAVQGYQTTQGLRLLNDLLEEKAAQTSFVPYFEYDTTVVAVIGQETYFIQNCIYLESLTFNIGDLRLEMNSQNRRAYFGSSRVDSITALPDSWNFLRGKGGGTLYLYPLPAGTYPLKIIGKFALTDVTLNTDMSAVYDGFYIMYLKFALAEYICLQNGVAFGPEPKARMTKMEYDLLNVSSPDMTCKRASFFNNGNTINVTSINYYRGYWPGGGG